MTPHFHGVSLDAKSLGDVIRANWIACHGAIIKCNGRVDKCNGRGYSVVMTSTTNPTAGMTGGKEATMATTEQFSNIQAGCLATGTQTVLGTIEAVSLTAYRIAGTWVPFQKIHGRPAMESPLVTFA